MIKFVYFDVGGVLLKDFSATDKWQQFQHALGIKTTQSEAFENLWRTIKAQATLDYDVDNLVPSLNQTLQLNLPSNFSLLNEFIIRFDQNPSIWPIVAKLKTAGLRVGLLTNMYPRMLEAINQASLLPRVDWDAIIDSSVVLAHKPDAKIYHLAQEAVNLPAEQILFIDNTPGHLTGAQKAGWQTHHYDSTDYTQSTQSLQQFFEANNLI